MELRTRETWKDLPEKWLEQTPEAQERRNITFLIQECALHEGVPLYCVIDLDDISEEDRKFFTDILPTAKAAILMGRPITDSLYRMEQLVAGKEGRITSVVEQKCLIHLLRFQEKLESIGYDAEYVQAPILPDFEFARILSLSRAGYVGKNGYLISEDHGCRTNMGILITSAPMQGGDLRYHPFEENKCGDCTKCIDACPAGALTCNGYDKEKCQAYRDNPDHIIKPSKYSWLKCDMCMRVCPQGSNPRWDKRDGTWQEILDTGEINLM